MLKNQKIQGKHTLLVAARQAPAPTRVFTASRCPCHAAINNGRIPNWNKHASYFLLTLTAWYLKDFLEQVKAKTKQRFIVKNVWKTIRNHRIQWNNCHFHKCFSQIKRRFWDKKPQEDLWCLSYKLHEIEPKRNASVGKQINYSEAKLPYQLLLCRIWSRWVILLSPHFLCLRPSVLVLCHTVKKK